MKTVHFGWEISNINNSGAAMKVPIVNPIKLVGLQFDVAFQVAVLPRSMAAAGEYAEVLCMIGVFPTAEFTPGKSPNHIDTANWNADFGAQQFINPAGLNLGGGVIGNGHLGAVILKTFITPSRQASATSRDFAISGLSLAVPAGWWLCAQMNHDGYPGDVEMTGTLYYE